MIVRALLTILLLIPGLTTRSSAGDTLEISPADYKKAEAGMRHWLTLADKAKYAEGFNAASELFRKDSTVEEWAAKHPKMLVAGPVVSRGKMVHFQALEKPSSKTFPSTYFVIFKTKFKKKSGTEELTIVKEDGEWKVAHYRVLIDK